MAQQQANTKTQAAGPEGTEVAVFNAPRLPYHSAIEERFRDLGVDRSTWKALVEGIFPLAQSTDSVVMALSYCKARNLDPFKRVVHIVPMWHGGLKQMIDTVWPGIAELRTTAFRTGQYAGRDKTVWGPSVTMKLGGVEVTFPEWAEITIHRSLHGNVLPFHGPRVYWLETYATAKKDTDAPNAMWRKRPSGQLEKCAEAAALRAAFPEEVGNDLAAEEMEGQDYRGPENAKDITPAGTAAQRPSRTADQAPPPKQASNGTTPATTKEPPAAAQESENPAPQQEPAQSPPQQAQQQRKPATAPKASRVAVALHDDTGELMGKYENFNGWIDGLRSLVKTAGDLGQLIENNRDGMDIWLGVQPETQAAWDDLMAEIADTSAEQQSQQSMSV